MGKNILPHQERQQALELPILSDEFLKTIDSLTKIFNVPREALASDNEISRAWSNLAWELSDTNLENLEDREVFGKLFMRMCVAISTGLFDGAINYMWNATIIRLRQKARKFGLAVIAQTLEKNFGEKELLEYQDSQLLNLCLKFNIISEQGFFFLNQCRETRNNFSAAHPTIGEVNNSEVTNFINRCITNAFSTAPILQGINISEFTKSMNSGRFTESQCSYWSTKISKTNEPQQELVFCMMHGLYCDPNSPEQSRNNVINLGKAYDIGVPNNIKSALIDCHSKYIAKGDETRLKASILFFEKLNLLDILEDREKHDIILKAISNLLNTHLGIDNFYREPPFAERLKELSESIKIHESLQEKFVFVVLCCYIGNSYGFSWGATSYYEEMIKSFSPREVELMFSMIKRERNDVCFRINNYPKCRERFSNAAKLIDKNTVPRKVHEEYMQWIS